MIKVYLPDQIRKQIERADELQGVVAAPLEDPPVPADGSSPEPIVEENTEAAPADQIPPIDPPAPAVNQSTPPAVDWEQRYLSLQGKFNADRQRMGELEAQLVAVNAQVTELSKKPPPEPVVEAISEEDLQAYGPQFFKVVEGRAKVIATSLMQPVERELKLLREQAKQLKVAQHEDVASRLRRQLNETLEGWDAQDNDQGFIDWCQRTPHPDVPGMNYRNVLDAAVNAGDVERVTRVLFAYPRATATRKGAPPTPSAPPARRDTGARPPADTAVMPPRGRATSAPEPQKGWVTTTELREHTNMITKGELRGEARVKAQKRIDDALREGRLMQG